MADNRARIQKDLEKSIIAGSIVTTDLNNEQQYTPPTTVGDVLVVGASGLPVWETPLDPARPWNKTGDLQATNNEGILTTDNILHEGRVNIGASEAETPFDLEYVMKVGDDALNIAHTRQYGIDVKTNSFKMNHQAVSTAPGFLQRIFLDSVNGIDGLEPTAYLRATLAAAPTPATATTPSFGYKFLTLKAAIEWINRYDYWNIQLIATGSTAGSRIILTEYLTITNKRDVTIGGSNAANILYIDIQPGGGLQARGSNVTFLNMDVLCNANESFWCATLSTIYFNNRCTFTLGATVTTFCVIAGIGAGVLIDGIFNVTFGANNQVLFHPSGNGGGKVILQNHTPVLAFTTGGFTGLRWASNSTANDSIETWWINIPAAAIPSTINISDTVFYYGTNQALNASTYNTLSYNYSQNLGTTKPTRWTDLLPSSADLTGTTLVSIVENELGEHGKLNMEWDTAGRPATPRLGQDGWNSTLASREYWNGTIWKSY